MKAMATTHGRRLGLSGVALTTARNNRFDIQALTAVRSEVEAVLDESGYLVGAPFSWVTIAVRYGLMDADAPVYQPISEKYGDLPLSIEVDTNRLVGADLASLAGMFKRAVLLALVHAGKKYDRPTARLEAELQNC
jgi:hypothetical protein